MKFVPTALPEVVRVEPDVHRDARGFFVETWREKRWSEGGVRGPFVQDNHSRSRRGTLRGLHAQGRRPQGKLVRVRMPAAGLEPAGERLWQPGRHRLGGKLLTRAHRNSS